MVQVHLSTTMDSDVFFTPIQKHAPLNCFNVKFQTFRLQIVFFPLFCNQTSARYSYYQTYLQALPATILQSLRWWPSCKMRSSTSGKYIIFGRRFILISFTCLKSTGNLFISLHCTSSPANCSAYYTSVPSFSIKF